HQVIDDLCPDCRGLEVPVGPPRTPLGTVEQQERRGGGSRNRQRRQSQQQQQQQQSGQQYRGREQYSQHQQQRRRSDLTQQSLLQDQHLPQELERFFITPEDMQAINW